LWISSRAARTFAHRVFNLDGSDIVLKVFSRPPRWDLAYSDAV